MRSVTPSRDSLINVLLNVNFLSLYDFAELKGLR
jgi:hypothetical protein